MAIVTGALPNQGARDEAWLGIAGVRIQPGGAHHGSLLHEQVLMAVGIDQDAFNPAWLGVINEASNLDHEGWHGCSGGTGYHLTKREMRRTRV
jgi:hypothetical protein